MFAGLDFGTSNCSIAVIENNAPVLIPLEDGKYRLPSSLFIEHSQSAPASLTTQMIDNHISLLKDDAKTPRSLNHEQLVNMARKQL
ncbi:MAG: molecular chaperone, partial [Paraglaciecola chathamensis]